MKRLNTSLHVFTRSVVSIWFLKRNLDVEQNWMYETFSENRTHYSVVIFLAGQHVGLPGRCYLWFIDYSFSYINLFSSIYIHLKTFVRLKTTVTSNRNTSRKEKISNIKTRCRRKNKFKQNDQLLNKGIWVPGKKVLNK